MWHGNDRIFRTYVKGHGKKPAEKVKGRDHINTWEQVKNAESFGAMLRPEYIDISFDTQALWAAFLDMAEANDWRCLALPSTKGGHSYWKKPDLSIRSGADKKLAVGLIADIHMGDTYIPLCVDGVKRFPPDYDVLDDEEYQTVPDELMPVDTNIDLWQMKDGDSRNTALFGYILPLQSQLQLSQEVIQRVLHNANDFVLADPLPKDEMETILRDEAFEKPSFFNKDKFLFDVFAKWLIKQCNVMMINGQLHVYRDGIYTAGTQDIEKEMISNISNLKRTQRKEVMDYMQLEAETGTMADARYIAFANGIYDIVSDTMQPFSPDMVITNKIPWDYNKTAYDQTADETLDSLACNDPEIRALLEECIGYCFYRRNELRKAFILTGGKRGGKSTYLDCIKAILGDDNVSALDLREVGDRFSTAMMAGKLANIGDDIGDEFLQGAQVSMFKKIVAGNRVKAEYKGQDPFNFDPYVKLLFSANDIPRMKDRGGAVLDRLIILPFNNYFGDGVDGYRPYLKYELIQKGPLEYLIRLGVDGLKRILAHGFTDCTAVNVQLDAYDEANNPVLAFIRESGTDTIYNHSRADVFDRYKAFCDDNKCTAIGKINFVKQINQRLGTCIQRVKNSNEYVFVRVDDE